MTGNRHSEGSSGDVLLQVDGLTKAYPVRRTLGERIRRAPTRRLVAVEKVSFGVRRREVLGIVGESGSGKTTLGRCLIRLVDPDNGTVRFDGIDVRSIEGTDLRRLRRRVQMVFQDPFTSLNPRLTVGAAILEAGKVHGLVEAGHDDEFVARHLESVGLSATLADRRPRQLSGGQRQRVAIARALAVGPDMLVADEPVSALDVSIQAQIINLFRDLQARLGLTMIFIAHQLSVVSQVADTVAVMYMGRIVERGPLEKVFGRPEHPYTQALLASRPDPNPHHQSEAPLRGDVPSPLDMPPGCKFSTRCPFVEDLCHQVEPTLESTEPGHLVACHVRPRPWEGDGL
ncbi:MAG: ATP-binding cassette domain-containing protein [bacterium]|nr:ATP-binding cassette domain-containing protein [bacterium]MDE0290351.1 ATP-binding cassette domain-containing protein [bacterium]MDE0438557.1 ATP-binding cassette domain-containing protein [bacterium]